MGTIFDTLINKILALLQSIWTAIFGGWSYQSIFFWLPADIRAAVDIVIVTLFGLALWKLLMQIIPH